MDFLKTLATLALYFAAVFGIPYCVVSILYNYNIVTTYLPLMIIDRFLIFVCAILVLAIIMKYLD